MTQCIKKLATGSQCGAEALPKSNYCAAHMESKTSVTYGTRAEGEGGSTRGGGGGGGGRGVLYAPKE